jgi:phosphatidylglycerol:prolipoprotein diacylglycerol transferase
MSLSAAALPFPHLNPVLLELPGPLALRWYGLMYLVGFALGYWILRRLADRGRLPVTSEQVGEIVGWVALGVIVGGRIGFLLFYAPESLAHPLDWIKLWEGGLSFHGGLAGVILLLAWYIHRHKIPFLGLTDGIVLAAPPGIAAVRLANFINAELYGRVTTEALPWAMRFPSDPVALRALGLHTSLPDAVYRAVHAARLRGEWAAIEAQIPFRHPSQLYEAALEGVLLFLLLWLVVGLARRGGWRLRPGIFGGLFLVGYGIFRSLVEQYRQPDLQFTGPGNALGTVLGPLTMGQVLSLVTLAAGIFVLWFAASGRGPEGPAWPIRPARANEQARANEAARTDAPGRTDGPARAPGKSGGRRS